MRISIENGLVTISTGTGQAQVPADQIDYIVNALKAAQMLVGIAPLATPVMTMSAPPAAAAAPVKKTKAATKAVAKAAPVAKAVAKAAPAVAVVAPVVVPKRRGRPPKNPGPDGQSLTKRRSRKRVGDALEAWLRLNPGWYTEAELLALVKREQMSDADPNRALKIALGKQKDVLFITDAAGRWSLIGTAAGTGAKASKPGRPAKADKPTKAPKSVAAAQATKPATAKRAPGARKRQSTAAGAGKKSDTESSPSAAQNKGTNASDDSDKATAAKPLRVKKGENRDEVLQAGRKASEAGRPSGTWPTTQQDRERIRRNLFGE